MEFSNRDANRQQRILVAIASYGTGNDRYLYRVVEEYRSMSFDIDVVIVSNLHKRPFPEVECLVGLPNKNPWSLPFAHKKLFADRSAEYDLFIYSEDDILITERNLRAFLEVTPLLREDEVAGFLRIERGPNAELNYPDVHANYHWDVTSVRTRDECILANFTNLHAACYVLTKPQLAIAISSGGFLVEPHEETYDLLCTAATDPYTQCGLTKLIAISRFNDFLVDHLPNKYVNKVGVGEPILRRQIDALMAIAKNRSKPTQLISTTTRLHRGGYSKDYYEPVSEDVISLMPKTARNALSIGCGWGAIERRLSDRGLKITAVPLDPVVCCTVAGQGVEVLYGDFATAMASVVGKKFDCILCLNVLHLFPNPAEILASFRSLLNDDARIIVQIPNMVSFPAIRSGLRDDGFVYLRGYDSTGTHVISLGRLEAWCKKSGLKTHSIKGIYHRLAEKIRHRGPALLEALVPRFIRYSMATSIIVSCGRDRDERAPSRREASPPVVGLSAGSLERQGDWGLRGCDSRMTEIPGWCVTKGRETGALFAPKKSAGPKSKDARRCLNDFLRVLPLRHVIRSLAYRHELNPLSKRQPA